MMLLSLLIRQHNALALGQSRFNLRRDVTLRINPKNSRQLLTIIIQVLLFRIIFCNKWIIIDQKYIGHVPRNSECVASVVGAWLKPILHIDPFRSSLDSTRASRAEKYFVVNNMQCYRFVWIYYQLVLSCTCRRVSQWGGYKPMSASHNYYVSLIWGTTSLLCPDDPDLLEVALPLTYSALSKQIEDFHRVKHI